MQSFRCSSSVPRSSVDDVGSAGRDPAGVAAQERDDALQAIPFQRGEVQLISEQQDSPFMVDALQDKGLFLSKSMKRHRGPEPRADGLLDLSQMR